MFCFARKTKIQMLTTSCRSTFFSQAIFSYIITTLPITAVDLYIQVLYSTKFMNVVQAMSPIFTGITINIMRVISKLVMQRYKFPSRMVTRESSNVVRPDLLSLAIQMIGQIKAFFYASDACGLCGKRKKCVEHTKECIIKIALNS